MAHVNRGKRIAQIVGVLLDSPCPLTTYGIARKVKMSVSPHLRGLIESAFEMGLIKREMVRRANGVDVALYTAHASAVEANASIGMLNLIWVYSDDFKPFEKSEIPF